MKKAGRNDPCSCGSGKKFKKCCESISARGKFKATLVDAQSAPQIQKTLALSSFFQSHFAAIPEKSFFSSGDAKVILEKNEGHLVT